MEATTIPSFIPAGLLRANDFIITGESFDGVYVPMTAKRIFEGNQNAAADAKINLKKFVVGNGLNEFSVLSKIAFAYFHGLLNTDAYVAMGTACRALLTPGQRLPHEVTEACADAVNAVYEKIQDININNYNIYAKCDGRASRHD